MLATSEDPKLAIDSEGAKRDGAVLFANSNPLMVAFFCAWLRYFFDIDESRLRMRVYLRDGLDLDEATRFWSRTTGIPSAGSVSLT